MLCYNLIILLKIILSPLLWVLSIIYYISFSTYKILYLKLKKAKKFDISKVICIGNISLGGSGKTELVRKIASELKDKGSVVIISRGYKRKSKEKILCLEEEKNIEPSKYGDEPSLLFKELTVPIVVGNNKKDIIEYAIEKYHPRYLISDNGYQNFSFYKDLNILIVNLLEFNKINFLFPLGNLRETLKSAIKRANYVILNHVKFVSRNVITNLKGKIKKWNKDVKIITLYYKIKNYINLYSKKFLSPSEFSLVYRNIILCCGIGQPIAFSKMLEKEGLNIIKRIFYPDHHYYTDKDLKRWYRLGNLPIVVTYKDAIKLQKYLNELDRIYLEKVYYVEIDLEIDEGKDIWQQMINLL